MRFMFVLAVSSIVFQLADSPEMEARAETVVIDKVVASVNGKVIFLSEWRKAVGLGRSVLQNKKLSEDKDYLDDLVDLALIEESLYKSNNHITDGRLEKELSAFLSKRQLSKEQLKTILKGQGVEYRDYLQDFKTQMSLGAFQQSYIARRVKITERDLQAFFLERNGGQKGNGLVELEVISVAGVGQASLGQTRKSLFEDIREKLKEGVSFDIIKNLYSTSSVSTYKLQERTSNLGPEVRKAIDGLQADGDVSEPFLLGETMNIVRVAGFSALTYKDSSADQVAELKAELRRKKMLDETQNWLRQEREKAKIRYFI